MQALRGGAMLDLAHFPPVFLLVAAVSALALVPFLRLPRTAGAALLPGNPNAD
jgi:hypothetical protein